MNYLEIIEYRATSQGFSQGFRPKDAFRAFFAEGVYRKEVNFKWL